MFEKYTEKARRVIFFARYEASQYGASYIETEHLLLGLMREDRSLASRFLGSRNSIESVRKEIESRIPVRERISVSVEVPLSLECKRVLNFAAEEAERLAHRHVGTEHLLLGILREEKSFASEILVQRGLSMSSVREELARKFDATLRTVVRPEWCCSEFKEHCYRTPEKENGLGILWVTSSKTGTHFVLEYRRPNRDASERIAEDGSRLRFCPWCGCSLHEQYGSGLPPFTP